MALTRFELVVIFRIQVTRLDLRRRAYAVEAVMEALAGELGVADVEAWRMVGLGSGLDLQLCVHNDARRGELAYELLVTDGAKPEVADAVLARHTRPFDDMPPMAVALVAADALVDVALAEVADEQTLDEIAPIQLERKLEALGSAALERLGVEPERAAELALAALRAIRQDLRL